MEPKIGENVVVYKTNIKFVKDKYGVNLSIRTPKIVYESKIAEVSEYSRDDFENGDMNIYYNIVLENGHRLRTSAWNGQMCGWHDEERYLTNGFIGTVEELTDSFAKENRKSILLSKLNEIYRAVENNSDEINLAGIRGEINRALKILKK